MTSHDDTLRRLVLLDHRSLGLVQDMTALLSEMQGMIRDLVQQNVQLERLATTDPLTNLANRRGFEAELAREEARAQRERGTAAVAVMDVRRLKVINERFGHSTGDELLRAVAHALRSSARGSDVVARLGGDEFAVLLPGASCTGGDIFVQRVRNSVQSLLLPSGSAISVQLSAGIAVRDEVGSLQEAFQLADGRLLLDKQRAAI